VKKRYAPIRLRKLIEGVSVKMHHPSNGSFSPRPPLVHSDLKTPRAAAIAGILFSVLLIASLLLLRTAVPVGPREVGDWLKSELDAVSFALNLLPFAGVAFLWFLGVLRDRLGEAEDQFFATVFMGSGLLFLAMLFVATAAMSSLLHAHSTTSGAFAGSLAYAFARAFAYEILHVYAFKMAAVFTITTSTLAVKTQLAPRWIAYLGYGSALFLVIGGGFVDWAPLVFPSWVLLISAYILIDNLRRPRSN
jgi:hypothetical protein